MTYYDAPNQEVVHEDDEPTTPPAEPEPKPEAPEPPAAPEPEHE